MGKEQNGIFPNMEGGVPILIQKKIWKRLIVLGFILPLFVVSILSLSDANHFVQNSISDMLLIEMTLCLVLLPLTGLIRKLIYAIPIPVILSVIFFPLTVSWIYEKIRNPQTDLSQRGIYSLIHWLSSIIVEWIMIIFGVSILVIFTMSITILSKKL